jgi:Trk K+ transport system NAD-binding subunit
MYVCNVRWKLQIEIEQRYVVSCLGCKERKLPAIVSEPAAVYHEDAFDANRMKYWRHEINSDCSDLTDRPSSGRSRLKDIDARILQVLEAESWSSVEQSLSDLRFLLRQRISIQPLLTT